MKHIRKFLDWFFAPVQKASQPKKPVTRFEMKMRKHQREAAERLIQK